MDTLTEILSQINTIESRFNNLAQPAGAPSQGFADALASAQDTSQFGAEAPVTSTGLSAGSATPTQVVSDAAQYLGVPYKWGGTDPSTGLDCSGLVQKVYGDLGISMPRVAADQAHMGTAVPSLAEAQPGDLVTYGSPAEHIGIYIGDGKMINAPHTGTVVRVDDVGTPTSIRRIIGTTSSSSGLASSGLSQLFSSQSGSTSSSDPLAALIPGNSSAQQVSGTPYDSLFNRAAATYGVPANLLAAVAQTESNFNPSAVSGAGAEGLMQIMPSTAASLGVNPMDPAQAVDGAARILASNLASFGSVPLAVAAYNAGGGAVRQYGGIPPYPETQNYVTKVLAAAGMS